MAGEILSSSVSTDQEKFVVAKLVQRLQYKLLAQSVCEKVKQRKGTGLTATFIRYKRMNVPLTPISSEGTDPSNSSFSVEQFTVTLDQWGDVITITDVAELTTLHPLLQEAINLLSDNAQRVLDREVQIVWFTGTNVMFPTTSITARASVTSSDKISDSVIHRARIILTDSSGTGGAQPRFGPGGKDAVVGNAASAGAINGPAHFLAICGPQVMADVQAAGTSLGTWTSVMMYNNPKNLYNAEVGMWLGFRWVETNFIPKLTRLGDNTAAVTSGNAFGTDTPVVSAVNGGGSLKSSTTFFFKVTRKNLLRGFEEDISLAHSMASAATGDNESFTFNFSSLTAGYVYNLYFDTVAAGGTGTDATLGLVQANIAVGTTVTVTANPAATTTAPANTANGVTVHPVYFHGAESCYWVGLQDLQVMMTKDESIIGNVLRLKRAIGYKFLAKAMIADQARLLRLETASSY